MKSCEKRNYSLRRDYRRKSQEAPGSARQASQLTSFFLRVGMELQHSLSTKQCYLFLQEKKMVIWQNLIFPVCIQFRTYFQNLNPVFDYRYLNQWNRLLIHQ